MRKRKIVKILVAVLICVGGAIFLVSQLKLEKVKDRDMAAYVLSAELKKRVEESCVGTDNPQDIIENCSEMVCGMLTFSAKNHIAEGKANCVGYAQLTAAIINHAFQTKQLPYHAKPVVGKVYLFGIDLNNVAQKILPDKYRPFFKDHDYVEINLGERIIYKDTSLQDFSGLNFTQTPDL